MPSPIVPIHKQTTQDDIIDQYAEGLGLSALQEQFLGKREAARPKYAEPTLRVLEAIYKAEDELLTFAQSAISTRTAENDTIYRVPSNVSDYDLLGLKTAGLVVGHGRAVKITEAGKKALAALWLKSDNDLRTNREKPKFDLLTHQARLNALRKAEDEGGNVRVSRFKQDNTRVAQSLPFFRTEDTPPLTETFGDEVDGEDGNVEQMSMEQGPDDNALVHDWIGKNLGGIEQAYGHNYHEVSEGNADPSELDQFPLDTEEREFVEALVDRAKANYRTGR